MLRADGVIYISNGNTRLTVKRLGNTRALKMVLTDTRLVVLADASVVPDQPYRVEVYSAQSGRALYDWPLVGRPATLDLYGDLMLFSARNTGGVFAMRLTDGKTTNLGPVRPGDTPQIGRRGVVFQSNRNKRAYEHGRVFMKFVPTAVVRSELEKTVDQLERPWPIKAFAMDGPRVAVTLDTAGKTCDAVGFWNVPRHWFVRVNMVGDLTCAQQMNVGSDLAIAGIGAGWVGTKPGRSEVFFSDTTSCVEEVAGRATRRRTPMAGDGLLLAFGGLRTSGSRKDAVALVKWKTEEKVLVRSPSPALALSVDQDRVAVLRADRTIHLLTSDGASITTLRTKAPLAIALRGNDLAVVTRAGRLEIWNVNRGSRVHSWQLPRGTTPAVDLHFGVAVFSAGRTVYGLRLDSGRAVALAQAPRSAHVQIEAPGVVYQYNVAGRGFLRFIPLAAVERTLG